jgi:hypothetical protein
VAGNTTSLSGNPGTVGEAEVGTQLVQLGEQALGQVDWQAPDLDLQARLMLSRRLDHHDIAAIVIGDQ